MCGGGERAGAGRGGGGEERDEQFAVQTAKEEGTTDSPAGRQRRLLPIWRMRGQHSCPHHHPWQQQSAHLYLQ